MRPDVSWNRCKSKMVNSRKPDSSRREHFEVSGETLAMDSIVRRLIVGGGLAVIFSVLAIFFFILLQVLPLLAFPRVSLTDSTRVDATPLTLGIDPEAGQAILVSEAGDFFFYSLDGLGAPPLTVPNPFAGEGEVTSLKLIETDERWVAGLDDGSIRTGSIEYPVNGAEEAPLLLMENKLKSEHPYPVRRLDYALNNRERLTSVFQESLGGEQVITLWREERAPNLLGEAHFGTPIAEQVTLPEGRIREQALALEGRLLLLLTENGEIVLYRWSAEGWEGVNRVRPFPEDSGDFVTGMDVLAGGGTVVVWADSGRAMRLTPFFDQETLQFDLVGMGAFQVAGKGVPILGKGTDNRVFLMARGNMGTLYLSNLEKVRWRKRMPEPVAGAVLDFSYSHLLLLGNDGTLSHFQIRDPYPAAGWKAFFGRVHYEGRASPSYEWQTSGATDTFEPKYSLVPLILGSLKGTFFALLFSAPLAICAALYTSQFLSDGWRLWVKPTIELMASIPSVILGFLAALWLGPLFFKHVPSILGVMVSIPIFGLLGGRIWGHLRSSMRRIIEPGHELILVLPLFMSVVLLGWSCGPWLERLFFGVVDPGTGELVYDFRLWWGEVLGRNLEQRNSLVVGFMMGFAVIPLIYSIAEEAFSSVPRSLISGSLALGASRWQTARRVVIPTASAGMLSALMIGVGRALGETMIVLMAAGNTPLMDLNLMTGFRALSATLAVELPEAPFGEMLFRTLFLGAFLLFIFTFIINTFAEFLRDRLRESYRNLE